MPEEALTSFTVFDVVLCHQKARFSKAQNAAQLSAEGKGSIAYCSKIPFNVPCMDGNHSTVPMRPHNLGLHGTLLPRQLLWCAVQNGLTLDSTMPLAEGRIWGTTYYTVEISGCFIKLEQWERWRDKRKLVSGSKHRGRLLRYGGISPRKKIEIVYAIPAISAFYLENSWQLPSILRS